MKIDPRALRRRRDIGFALLPPFRAAGYAYESAAAVLAYAANELGFTRVLAVVNPENAGSITVLEKLGMRFDRMVRLSHTAPEVKMFAIDA